MLLLCADVRDVFTAVQDTHVLHSQPNMFSVCVSCSLSDGVYFMFLSDGVCFMFPQ